MRPSILKQFACKCIIEGRIAHLNQGGHIFLSKRNLQHIINKKSSGNRLSIYIPTHPSSTSQTLTEDIIRFKNALQRIKANEQYEERELGATVKKMESLLDNQSFWKHRTLGLAVFADQDGYETIDLNYEITETEYLQDRFVVSPLVMMLSLGNVYYVLDINHTKPRLLHFTSHINEEIELKDMPSSFEETIDRDEHTKRLQHQSAPANMYHGHSEDGADAADELRYYKLIAEAVNTYLADHDEPLLLTGTENRIGHMRPLLDYGNLVEITLTGSSEDLNEQELQDASLNVIETANIKNQEAQIAAVKSAPKAKVVVGAKDIEAAIQEGRVESLYLSAFKRTADNVRDGEKARVVLQLPDDVDDLESLVRETMQQGGDVVALREGSFDSNEPLALCRF